MGRESSELHRMESHIKELQAENAELTEAWNTQGKVLIERKREIAKLQAELKHSQAMVGMANKKLKEVTE
jgi:predicted RNase H-like nuclease (RuvC/YqgF family)